MSTESFVAWLAETPGSIALHESLHVYSYVETAHVIGIMLFVGTIAMVDLRLLGVSFRQVPVSEMNARILPWTVAGFVLMVATGLALFYAIPVRSFHSIWFRTKVVLLLIAAINIWVFHRRVQRNQAEWDTAPKPPLNARIAAAISLSTWALVIVMGRFIAYNWFDCDRRLSGLMQTLTGCPTGGL
jgi:uncharacterized membrane protein SirB2